MLKTILKFALPAVALLIGFGGAAALVAAQKEVKTQTPEKKAPRVTVIKVMPEDTRYTVTTHGNVSPRTETDLTAEIAGRITGVHPSFVNGGFFNAGEAIVTIDDTTYQAALLSAQAQLARAQAALKREQAESDLAEREWKKYGEGEPDPLVLREPQLAEAKANVTSAEAAVEKAQNDVDRASIKVPYDGRVRAKLVEQGQFVGLGVAVARVYATDYAEVRLPVSGREATFLNLPFAQTLEFEDESAPEVTLSATYGSEEHTWNARIVRTEAEVDPRTRMIYAVARVKDPYDASRSRPLMPNMFVRANITGRDVKQVFVVPRLSVRPDGTVLVVDAKSRIRIREVRVARLTEDEAVIVSGLEQGERILTSDPQIISEGMIVNVVRELPGRETP